MLTEEKTYILAESVNEAIKEASLQKRPFKFAAGGTDVFVNKYQGNDTSQCIIDISQLDELKKIEIEENSISIGALVKLNELGKSEIIQKEFPALIEAANSVGSPLIRASATIGGNILCENRCIFYNQSDWWRDSVGYCLKCEGDICIATGSLSKCYSELVSDTAPVLISMDATIDITGINGITTKKLENIYTGEGVNPRNLDSTSLITAIKLPRGKIDKAVFKKLRIRQSMDFTSLTSSVSVNRAGNIKVVLGGVDPGPVICPGKLDDDPSIIINQALKKSRAIDNETMTRTYRREMIKLFILQSLEELKKK